MNCRGDHGIDAKRSRPSIGKTRDVPREQRTRANVWDPISGLHQGQRPQRLHQQAEYMAAPERFAEMPDFFPCTAGAVHTWHFAIKRGAGNIPVAIGGKADISQRLPEQTQFYEYTSRRWAAALRASRSSRSRWAGAPLTVVCSVQLGAGPTQPCCRTARTSAWVDSSHLVR